MKITPFIYSVGWYLFATLLFFINICSFFLFHQQLLYLVIALFTYQMQLIPTPRLRLVYLGLLIFLESGIYYGIWGLPLLYLIPAYMFFDRSQQLLHITGTYQLIPLMGIILLQTITIEWYILGIYPGLFYTMVKIIGTLLVGMFFSLTQKSLGTSGNRSYV